MVRLIGPVDDLPASYAVASVVVSAAVQQEGLQRAILEGQAMERPVVVSDLGAGPEVVLAPPAVPEERMTGLRFSAGDDAALAAGLRPPVLDVAGAASRHRPARPPLGAEHFNRAAISDLTLRLYSGLVQAKNGNTFVVISLKIAGSWTLGGVPVDLSPFVPILRLAGSVSWGAGIAIGRTRPHSFRTAQ